MAKGRFVGNAWTKTSVDADTVVNKANKNNEPDYFHLVINCLLKSLDHIAPDGTIGKGISVTRHCIDIVRSSISPDSVTTPVTDDAIVPDSGAASHMRKDRSIFEENYGVCNNMFVLMGDGTEILVLGYDTPWMKVDGHVTRLINSLRVPGLDCGLFSCIRNDMMGKDYTFVLGDRKMHLTFPKFTIIDAIPVNGDLRIRLDPLTEEN